jgi:hypothetical protein
MGESYGPTHSVSQFDIRLVSAKTIDNLIAEKQIIMFYRQRYFLEYFVLDRVRSSVPRLRCFY